MNYILHMPAKKLDIQLQVSILKQGKSYIAYSPALDFSTSGKNKKEAMDRFDEAVQIFFEELDETSNVESALLELGWKKQKKIWQPPQVIAEEAMDFQIPVHA